MYGQNAAVPQEVSAELLTLVPTKNKGGREKHYCKLGSIRLFISILKMMRKKVIGCIVLFRKKKLKLRKTFRKHCQLNSMVKDKGYRAIYLAF